MFGILVWYDYSFVLFFVFFVYYAIFFTPLLADGLPLEFELQQVSSSFQDSSHYSHRS